MALTTGTKIGLAVVVAGAITTLVALDPALLSAGQPVPEPGRGQERHVAVGVRGEFRQGVQELEQQRGSGPRQRGDEDPQTLQGPGDEEAAGVLFDLVETAVAAVAVDAAKQERPESQGPERDHADQ